MPNPLLLFVLDRLNAQSRGTTTRSTGTTTQPAGRFTTTGGIIFPVSNGTFGRGWGQPRSGGRKHKGVDIFAPKGSSILAPTNGRIEIGTGGQSGKYVRFFDGAGNKYFMGHLDGFSMPTGSVKAGQVIGYVGNTGNARGTSPHVHFEYHPKGSGAVDPYGLLTSWKKSGGTVSAQPTNVKNYGSNQYAQQIAQASQKYGVPYNTLTGLLYTESSFNPKARVVDKYGREHRGLGQMGASEWRSAAKATGVNPNFAAAYNPNQAIPAIAWLVGQKIRKYNGDIDSALAAYYGGDGNAKNRGSQIMTYINKVKKYGAVYGGDIGTATPIEGPPIEETTAQTNTAYDSHLRALVSEELRKEKTRTMEEAQREITKVRSAEMSTPLEAYEKQLAEHKQRLLKNKTNILRGGFYGNRYV